MWLLKLQRRNRPDFLEVTSARAGRRRFAGRFVGLSSSLASSSDRLRTIRGGRAGSSELVDTEKFACAPRRVASTAYDNERPPRAAFRSRYVACNIFNVAHRVISPTQNGAQKCTKVVRDAPLRGARSFPFSASFSRKPPTSRNGASPLLFAPPPPLSFSFSPAGRFMCLYKPETSANCSRLAVHVHGTRVCM